MLEIKFQSKLVHLINQMDAMAFKTSNRFMVGMPDLFIKMRGFPGLFLEIKRDTSKGDIISGRLSPMQVKIMRDLRKYEQPVGWLIFRSNQQGRHWVTWGRTWRPDGIIEGLISGDAIRMPTRIEGKLKAMRMMVEELTNEDQ